MQNREAWLAERRTGIGGSDIAGVLGFSPWSSPYDVWRDKIGEGDEVDPNSPPIYWGNILEDVVAKEYQTRTGRKVQRVNATMRHPEHRIAMANIDRAVVNPAIAGRVQWKNGRLTTDRLLECKTSSAFKAPEWGAEGTDDFPVYYLTQNHWYGGVTSADTVDLAALIGGNDYRIYTIAADRGLFHDMLEEAHKFWRLVETRTAPDPQTVADAMHRWAKHIDGKTEIADVQTFKTASDLQETKEKMKALKKREDALKLNLMRAFEDAEALTHGGNRFATWKAQDATRIDVDALRNERPDIADLYSKTTTSRVLRLNTKAFADD